MAITQDQIDWWLFLILEANSLLYSEQIVPAGRKVLVVAKESYEAGFMELFKMVADAVRLFYQDDVDLIKDGLFNIIRFLSFYEV